jgi:transcriptional regulator of acetoin/glycerol metabolism
MPRKPTPAKSLLRLLQATRAPLYVLDDQRRIVFGNAAFSAWIGRPIEDIAGLRCDYHSSGQIAGASELAAALCPPPEALAGERLAGQVACPGTDGKLQSRPAQFVPLGQEGASPAGVLVLVAPTDDEREVVATAPPTELTPEELHRQLQELRNQLGRRFHISQFIGQTPAIEQVREQIRLASEARTRVVVIGPPGSGRAHVAKTIHYNRVGTAAGPLAPIDCPLMNAELLQATLTAFLRRQAELPPNRSAAVLLLDVDRLTNEAQQELAGFLRLPGLELPTLATSRVRLQRLARKGKFRHDLAYALSTLSISLPPLAGRAGDVPLLAQFFLEEFNALGGQQLSGFAPDALDKLSMYEWPQNVRELSELVRQACECAAGPAISAADLPDRIHFAAGAIAHPPADDEVIQLDDYLAEIEKELLQRALRRARGNKTKAASLLGMHRARLIRRLVQLGLAAPTPREEPIIFEPLPDEDPTP